MAPEIVEIFQAHTCVDLMPIDMNKLDERCVHPISEANLVRGLSAFYEAAYAAGKSAAAVDAKRDTFEEWLKKLDAEFVKANWMAAGESYVAQTGPDVWRDFYDDGYTPEQAQQEEASCL